MTKLTLIFANFLLMGCIMVSCDNTARKSEEKPKQDTRDELKDTLVKNPVDYNEDEWYELGEMNNVLLDIRYATKNNFTKEIIYPCGRCFLRPGIGARLDAFNQGIMKRYGLRLKLFDCYRPRPAQQKLWDIMPNASYVTPPAKGSMHNRGMAVDLTLVDKDGLELDMGTEYDYFGIEAHTDNFNLPEEVLKNRKLLRTMMEEIGFKGIRTEWWHFSYKGETMEISNWEWECDKN